MNILLRQRQFNTRAKLHGFDYRNHFKKTRAIQYMVGEDKYMNVLLQLAADIKSLSNDSEFLNETQAIVQAGIWKRDLQTGELNWSDEMFSILEIDKATTPSSHKKFLSMIHPEDRDKMRMAFNNSVINLKPLEITHRLVMPDGRIKWVKECCEAICDQLGKPKFISGTIKDITGRKLAEDALCGNEQHWRLALDSGGCGLWEWDLKTGEVVLSVACRTMFGFADDEIVSSMAVCETRVHPDDRLHWKEILRTLFHNKLDRFSIEYRVSGRDGNWKWMLTHAIVTGRSDDGRVLRMTGTQSDISMQKNTEIELQFANTVYQAIGEAVMITDSSNRIVAVNNEYTQLTGYASSEVIGRPLNFMFSERHDEAFKQAIWHKLNATGIWEGEIWIQRKNGEEHAEWQLIHTSYDNKGDVLKRAVLISEVTEQKRTEETIRRHAYYDPLTGLPNRRLFQDRLGLEIRKANRANLPIALLYIDLDNFKEVNDKLGHEAGDSLLHEAALRISACVRESDTVARLSGDEFTVILSEIPDTRHTDYVAQKITTSLAMPYQIGGEIVHVSASIGISLFPDDAKDISTLMKNADLAMYDAKNKGRNRFVNFDPSRQMAEQSPFISDLREALVAGQFRLFFQPIIDLSTGRISKAETLIRWQHPKLGMVSPEEFIPLAEKSGLINQIGDWVFKEAARYAKHWSKHFSDDFQVSVNISAVQFASEYKEFAAKWPHLLQEIGLSGRNLAVEVREWMMLNAESGFMGKLHEFREAGIQVAIDDSELDSLTLSKYRKYDIDYLKIVQPFILDNMSDPNGLALSEIIVMAHKLGFRLIAEGVETLRQHELLTSAKCDYAQGNFYSNPVPPEEFEALLQHGLGSLAHAEYGVSIKEQDHLLLTEQEAAAFLQPHMPNKNVNTWLSHDRQSDPIIPFFLVQGQPCYLETDLEKFVSHTLKTSARFIRLNNRLHPERRNLQERRRIGINGPLDASISHYGIKRRRRGDMGLRLHADLEHSDGLVLDRRSRSKHTEQ
jgi:diguanylate cyclase (GGDEF)-like protein/PAS domain S-box-containing protein